MKYLGNKPRIKNVAKSGFFVVLTLLSSQGICSTRSSRSLLQSWPSDLPAPEVIQRLGPRIIGGVPDKNEMIVGMYFQNENGNPKFCSGLYISTQYVLTAKHCTCHNNDFVVTNSQNMRAKSSIWVNGTNSSNSGASRAKLQFGERCERMTDLDLEEGGDIALISLKEPLPLTNGTVPCSDFELVRNIRFVGSWRPNTPASLSISGFGLDPDRGIQEQREVAEVPVNTLTCASKAARNLGCAPYRESIFGARASGAEILTDSCSGDSGGPAYVSSQAGIIPIGVVSRALPISQPSGDCGLGGIYTALGREDVIAWLRQYIPQQDTLCGKPLK